MTITIVEATSGVANSIMAGITVHLTEMSIHMAKCVSIHNVQKRELDSYYWCRYNANNNWDRTIAEFIIQPSVPCKEEKASDDLTRKKRVPDPDNCEEMVRKVTDRS